jgi:hypothetical protein
MTNKPLNKICLFRFIEYEKKLILYMIRIIDEALAADASSGLC